MIATTKRSPIKFVVNELQYIGRESIAYLTTNEICVFIVFSLFTTVGIPTDNVPSKLLRLVAVLCLIKGISSLCAKMKLIFIWGRTNRRSGLK